MVKIGELMMILDLHRQGLSVAAIARETGKDAKTIRRYIAHGLEPPVYRPRPPQACRLDPHKAYLQERITAYPQLSGRPLCQGSCPSLYFRLYFSGGRMGRWRGLLSRAQGSCPEEDAAAEQCAVAATVAG